MKNTISDLEGFTDICNEQLFSVNGGETKEENIAILSRTTCNGGYDSNCQRRAEIEAAKKACEDQYNYRGNASTGVSK